jgi:hypothetical protein
MFSNITEEILWELTPELIKNRDRTTSQLMYNGKLRGQTERFMIVLGDLAKVFFDDIVGLFSYKDSLVVDSEFLVYLQRELKAQFQKIELGTELDVRDVLFEIITAWRLKGVLVFLRWIVYKVYNWEVINIFTLDSQVLKYSVLSSFLYDSTKEEDEQKLLYSADLMVEDKLSIIIDVKLDPDFLEKKESFEAILPDWMPDSNVFYINTP